MFAAMKTGDMASYTPPPAAPTPSFSSSNGGNSGSGGRFCPQVKVMNIPENTDPEELKTFFSSVAVVKNVKILPLRDGRTTTMGFVDFETDADVQNVIQQKNDTEFNGSSLRLFEGNRSGGGGNDGNNNRSSSSNDRPQVKVYNIPSGSDEGELQTLFSQAGNVTTVKVLPCRDGKDVTLGFIHFGSSAEVENAVSMFNDYEFNGSNLRVMSADGGGGGFSSHMNTGFNNNSSGFNSSSNFGATSPPRSNNRPHIKVFNIPEASDELELRAFFSSAGNVQSVKVLPCRDGKDVTLGFVHFETSEEVEKAVQQFNDSDFNGSRLRVMSADGGGGGGNRSDAPFEGRPMGRGAQLLSNINSINNGGRPQRLPQVKVFGIPEGTDQDVVRDFFASAGNVGNVKILPIREGKDTHLGFVEFNTEAEVQAAVDQLDGQAMNESTLKVMPANNQGSNGMSGGSFQNNSQWSSNHQTTSRIPRDEQFGNSNGYSNGGDIKLESNFDMNQGMNEGMFDDGMPRAPVTYIPPPPPETEEEIFQQKINEGINFDKYEHIPVEITGNNPPKPISTFAEANLHEHCNMNILRAKYHKPTPVQKYAIPAVLSNRDLMACAQTGSGKTASFLLPVITNILKEGLPNTTSLDGAVCPLGLVIAPTRELAIQIFNEVRKFSYGTSLRAVVVYGGVSVNHQTDILQRGCHICVATPGRLDDFVKRGKLSFKSLKYMIFDEADRMLDMGFGPQINAVIDNSEMPPKGERITLMFSATFPTEIQQMAAKFLHEYLFLTVGRVGGACSDVQQTILQVAGSEKRNKLEKILQESGTDRTLVFVERKKDADFLASFLSQRNYPSTSLNGDRSQQERESALLDFRRGKAPVLVATAVAGRGLDIDDVKHVVNYDLPSDPTEYVHRIGRTGRIGNKGKATSFFDMQRDQNLARPIVRMLSEAEQEVPDWLEEFALSAVGTGYGQDKGNYRDRRDMRSGGGGAPYGAPPRTNQATLIAPADDDDEEW